MGNKGQSQTESGGEMEMVECVPMLTSDEGALDVKIQRLGMA
jgi:hypothetical protein